MHLRPHAPPNHGADPKPTPDQVAFADRILLNKTDLVEESELAPIEERLKKINPTAAVFRTEQSKADPSKLIGISAFKLEKVLDTAPVSLGPAVKRVADSPLSPLDTFARRHIGPVGADATAMLEVGSRAALSATRALPSP